MENIVITPKQIKGEVVRILCCFVIAFGLNVYAIIAYDGKWSELFWSLGFVAATTAILYAVLIAVRLTVWIIKKLITKK